MLGEQDYLILWVPNASDSIRLYKGQREKPEFALNHVSMAKGSLGEVWRYTANSL